MPRKPVGIVVAMPREVGPLLLGRRAVAVDGLKVFELESAVIAAGGIGRAAARRAADTILRRYSPSVLISAGIAGALTDALHVGDVVCARDVVDASSGARFAAGGCDETVATVSAVSGATEKRELALKWRADVVDMEASAVAAAAQEAGIDFMAIKSISDELDFEMPPVGSFVDEVGQFETWRFAAWLAVHPQWWGRARQLNANSRIAALKLSEALQHLIDQWLQSVAESKSVKAL